ncbi:hypothetical protein [Streptomyces sp. NPDC001404]|uniref:hypothetical protein n=1 Tax=Streptomyces sp. NPDC001404 TaxID=3364571 RepID=UPI0036C28FA4
MSRYDIGSRIAALENQVTGLQRSTRLSHASLEDGAVEVYDAYGSLRAVLGSQPDGTTGLTVVNGPAPPQPSTPTAAPAIGGIAVRWDGTFTTATSVPLDFARIEVHAGVTAAFTPTPDTLRGTLESPQGGTVVVTTTQPVYIRLLARNTSGVASEPSATAGPITPSPVSSDDMSVGVTGNLLPDPSFETGYVAGILAGQDKVAIEAGGNNSGHALRFDAALGEQSASFYYDRFAVSPGDQFWLACDYKFSADYAGAGLLLALRWYDADGNPLTPGTVSTSSVTADDTWRRLTGPLLTAPASAARGEFVIQTTSGTAGKTWVDNVECRPIMASGAAGQRAEISPMGLRLYDASGQEAVSLVTGRPNYLTLSTNGRPVATIDQAGRAGFQELAVAGTLSVGGDQLSTLLARNPRGIIAVDYETSNVTSTGTEMGWVELAFTADASRMYRVVVDTYADPSATGGELQLVLRDGGANTPTVASPQIQSAFYPFSGPDFMRVRLELVRSGKDFGAGLHRLLVTFRPNNGPAGQSVQLRAGSSYPSLMYVEDTGPYIPKTGVLNTGGGTTTPPVQQYTRTYAAAWSGSYANRSGYNGYYGASMLQGYYSSTNGMQASLVGFPSSLATDLSGATIQKAEIYLYFEHWYNNDGGTAVLKAHGHNARPSSFSCDSQSQSVSWAKNAGKWVDITSIFDSTNWRGIALDPNNNDLRYYGRAQGYGETNPPQLRVTYTK